MENTGKKRDIRNLSFDELKKFFLSLGEKEFRARQTYEWLWKKTAISFDQMSNLALDLRNRLTENFEIFPVHIHQTQKSKDGTIKIAFRLCDGELIEGVLIPSADRVTACISSQVGCNLGCLFCATSRIKYKRNLTAGEIFDQVVLIQKLAEEVYNQKLSNIVMMGMGEPLLNYTNVLSAINRMTSPDGLAISPRRITLSTVGIAKNIKKLADDNVKFNLAVSLHTAKELKRDSLMPVSKSISLTELSSAIRYFYEKTQTRVTFEYLLLRDVNDSLKDALALAEFCKIVPCKVNLIEYNETDDKQFHKSTETRTQAFMKFLENKNMIVNLRKSKGEDIDAACGQLANKGK